jgi:hypothetical protein
MKGSVKNIQGPQKLAHKIHMKKAMFRADIATAAVTAQMAIRQGLHAILGSGAEHFAVLNRGNQFGNTIVVSAIDDVGTYIYYGTAPHQIYRKNARALGSMERQFGPVDSVSHPGTPARGPEIDAEVRYVLAKVLMIFK